MSSSVSWVMNFRFTKSIIREALNDQKLGILWIMARVYRFLSDPGVSGVRSMGPVVSNSLTKYTLCKLNWCDSSWWRYKLNTNW